MSDMEVQLVRECLVGDESAFESLYCQHAPRIKAYLTRCGFIPADADDLAQETFLRAYGSLRTFDSNRGSLAGWLAAIARNVARKHWNRRGDARDFDHELAEQTLELKENPGQAAEANEEYDAVNDCISRLPEALAHIVRLRYVNARTTRGIAGALGIPEATVRLRLSEAAAAIERCLKSKGIPE
jgi:RNA polymerase sigma-70 factor (ECF subfamily)